MHLSRDVIAVDISQSIALHGVGKSSLSNTNTFEFRDEYECADALKQLISMGAAIE